jgi:hypothetical protein
MEVSAIEIFTLIYGGVLAWLALTNIQHMKKLAVIEKVLEGLVLKMDLFLKSEIDVLKDIANRK